MQRGQGTNFRATRKELTSRESREVLDPDWLWVLVHSLRSSRLKAAVGGAGMRRQRPMTPVAVSHSHPQTSAQAEAASLE